MTFYCIVNIILINFVALFFFFPSFFSEKDHIALDFGCVTFWIFFFIFHLFCRFSDYISKLVVLLTKCLLPTD